MTRSGPRPSRPWAAGAACVVMLCAAPCFADPGPPTSPAGQPLGDEAPPRAAPTPPVAPSPYPAPGWAPYPATEPPPPVTPESWDQPTPITLTPHAPPPLPGHWPAPPLPPRPPEPPQVDPLLPTGITLGALGVLALGAGAIAYPVSSSSGDELCGLSGCFERPDNDLKMAAVGLMAGGAALAALSVPVMIASHGEQVPARASDQRMVTGVVLTGVGVANAAAGFAALAAQNNSIQASDNDSEAAMVAVPLLLAGGSALAVGLPLWVSGGADWEPATIRPPDRPFEPGDAGLPEGVYVEKSTGMKVAGIVVTVLGSLAGVSSVAVFAAGQEASNSCQGECDFTGVGESIVAGVLATTAVVHLGVGIPLWAVGASDELVHPDDPRAVRGRQEATTIRPPEIKLSPSSVQLDWRF